MTNSSLHDAYYRNRNTMRGVSDEVAEDIGYTTTPDSAEAAVAGAAALRGAIEQISTPIPSAKEAIAEARTALEQAKGVEDDNHPSKPQSTDNRHYTLTYLNGRGHLK